MGFSGAPGVRQHIDKILKKTNYFALKVKPEDMNGLRDFATGEYIDLMAATEMIDAEDVVELQQAPNAVNELDSFRFFFVAAFLMPAYQKVSREARKRIKDHMAQLGIPAKLDQSVMNQVTGGAKRDRQSLKIKLDKLISSGDVPAESRDQIIDSLDNRFIELEEMGQLSDDLVQQSRAIWDGMPAAKREAVLSQALNQTADFQEQGA